MSKALWLIANAEARDRLMDEHDLDDEEDLDEDELNTLTDSLYEDRIAELMERGKHLRELGAP